jgi:LysM repeat protein
VAHAGPVRSSRSPARQGHSSGPVPYLVSLALLLPLGIVLLLATQLGAMTQAQPAGLLDAAGTPIAARRPASLEQAPPPTLAPPTATPKPTATPVPPTPTVAPTGVPDKNRTYVVQSGDQLKDIAAQYGVSIWAIVDSNHIPNPDSLTVGQKLKIPDA